MTNTRKSTGAAPAKDQTRRRIEQMEAEREQRRRDMIERKKARAQEEQRNIAAGNPGDVDFIGMVRQWRHEHAHEAQEHSMEQHPRICICVRKRPISEKERQRNDHDSVTCLNPQVWIHSAKLRVDGITKYLDHNSFHFDHAFDETTSTYDVYQHTTMPLLDFVCAGTGGRATVFAYGQTGSGKTHTMSGIQEILTEDLFLILSEGSLEGGCTLENTVVTVSFFEMYGGYVQDLLNERQRLKLFEDGKGEIIVTGLKEAEASDPESFLQLLAAGHEARTTQKTEANDTSSRSHAICQIMLRDRVTGEKLKGKLSLVDLAGSERGTDTKSHNQQRRAESADINTSLLSLKECIRALDMNKKCTKHVPYRGSKLTLILKDCFTSERAMTTMIATVSPGASAADHSINTLRYADRIKAQRPIGAGPSKSPVRKRISPRPTAASSSSQPKSSMSTVEQAHNNIMITPPLVSEPMLLPASMSPKKIPAPKSPTKSVGKSHPSPTARTGRGPISHQHIHEQKQPDTEELHRRTVEAILEQEESILSMHMSNIQENAELLTQEGDLLSLVQASISDPFITDEYASALEEILERKEDMIVNLQKKISVIKEHFKLEKELSEQVESPFQY